MCADRHSRQAHADETDDRFASDAGLEALDVTKMAEYIDHKILHFGAFAENLNKMVDLMNSEYPCSVIVRGNPGSGKKTLISEAQAMTGAKCVFINPYHHSDDYAALRSIAACLRLEATPNVSRLLKNIRDIADRREKLVIILVDFDEFCRKRQSFLYNVINLIHTSLLEMDKGPNITIVGLTANLDWSENLEKRVRSRLNAQCLDLAPPYRNKEEYIKFASELLDNHKIDDALREQLEYMYTFSNRSVRYLKKYLTSICSKNEKGKLKLDFDPEAFRDDYQQLNNVLLKERLLTLTVEQLDLLKLAVRYCFDEKKLSFSLADIEKSARSSNWNSFMDRPLRLLKNLGHLAKMRLIKPAKQDDAIGDESRFYPAVTFKQFKAVIRMDKRLTKSKTDALWEGLK